MTDDDAMLDRLRRMAARTDAPPGYLDETARAAFTLGRLDGELAELMMDSALVGGALVRDEHDEVRLLSFETDAVSIELQVQEVGERLALRGLVSGASGEAVVETAHGRRVVAIDEQGWFAVDGLPRGAVRVRLRAADGTSVTTSWVSI